MQAVGLGVIDPGGSRERERTSEPPPPLSWRRGTRCLGAGGLRSSGLAPSSPALVAFRVGAGGGRQGTADRPVPTDRFSSFREGGANPPKM